MKAPNSNNSSQVQADLELDTDTILVDNGEVFEGSRAQFRDCFFDNASNEEIIDWCNANLWSLTINDKRI